MPGEDEDPRLGPHVPDAHRAVPAACRGELIGPHLFICFLECGGEGGRREQGKWEREGREIIKCVDYLYVCTGILGQLIRSCLFIARLF